MSKEKVSTVFRVETKTKAGNTLSFFYNPDNSVLVVDLVHKSSRGGNELVRMTLNEKKLLGFCNKLPYELAMVPDKKFPLKQTK